MNSRMIFEYGEPQDVLGASGKAYVFHLRVRDMLIGEYVAVDELLEFFDVSPYSHESIYSGVFLMS